MIKLNIPDMSCGHCAGVITRTVKELDQDAVLDFNLPEHTVQVQTRLDDSELLSALDDAGYPATRQ
jgi:copper chaperone